MVEIPLDNTKSSLTLDKLKIGQIGIVDQIHTDKSAVGDGLRTRLIAIGLIEDKTILVMKKALMGGPIAIRVGWFADDRYVNYQNLEFQPHLAAKDSYR